MISKRPATVTDFNFTRSVHHRAYRDVIERQYGPWDETTQDRLFDAAWSAADHEILLWDAVPCGYCLVQNRADDIYVHEIVIDPDFQSRGIGTEIMQGVIEAAMVRNVPVRLRTQIINRAANLYRRLGFQETGRTDSHILLEWNTAGA